MLGNITFDIPAIGLANLLTLLTFLAVTLSAYFKLRERSLTNRKDIDDVLERLEVFDLGRTKFCVETLWVFQLRRGMLEAVTNDLGTEKSPFRLTASASQLLEPILPELKAFYKEIGGDKIGIVELSVALESKFGEKIVEEVCKKVNVTKAACMVVAISMLRPISQKSLTSALRDAEHNYKTLKRLEPNSSGTSASVHGSDEIILAPLRP